MMQDDISPEDSYHRTGVDIALDVLTDVGMTTPELTVGGFRERAGRVLQHVSLRDISVHSVSAHGEIPALTGPFTVEQEVSVKGEQPEGLNGVQAWAKYE